MTTVEIKAPGKLYLAGEYAVVTPGHSALVTAIDRFLTVKLTPTTQTGTYYSDHHTAAEVQWTRNKHDNAITFSDRTNRPEITQPLQIAEHYVQEQLPTIHFKNYHLTIKTELEDAAGMKYGLGSSGALTVALIQAVLTFYQVTATEEIIFKLAAISELTRGKKSSCGDLAATAFKKTLYYRSFDQSYIAHLLPRRSLTELVTLTWPKLKIQPLTLPSNWQLLVGWTGAPASTDQLVQKLSQKTIQQIEAHFLTASEQLVTASVNAINNVDFTSFKKAMNQNGKLLADYGRQLALNIMIPKLELLIKSAQKLNAPAKVSGAGGGDCGIAWTTDPLVAEQILSAWKQQEIIPLPLSIYSRN